MNLRPSILTILFSLTIANYLGATESWPSAAGMSEDVACSTSIVIIKRYIGNHIRHGGVDCNAISTGGSRVEINYAYTIPGRITHSGRNEIMEYTAKGTISNSNLRLTEIKIHTNNNTNGFIPIHEL